MGCEPILELAHSADGPHCVNGENDDGAHLDDELNEICPEHSPHPGSSRVRHGDDEADTDREYFSGNIESEKSDVVKPERDREDLDHRLGHPSKDDEVDRDRKVKSAKATERGGRLAAVTDFGKLDVRHDVGAPPQTREEEHGEHSTHQHVPPNPVSGDTMVVDEARHDEWCVGSEGRRDHRSAGEPPGHLTSGEEVFAEALAAALGEVEADADGEKEVGGNNRPVDRV